MRSLVEQANEMGQIINRGAMDAARPDKSKTRQVRDIKASQLPAQEEEMAKSPEFGLGTRIRSGSAMWQRTLNLRALHKIDTMWVLCVRCPTKGIPTA
jgi:hypothetical protein